MSDRTDIRKRLGFKEHKIESLSTGDIESVVEYCKPAFIFSGENGCDYNFNIDLAYSQAKPQLATSFNTIFASFIKKVVAGFNGVLKNKLPVLAYISEDSRAGIVQLRGVLGEMLPYSSVICFPNKKLLRARVSSDGVHENFPQSVQWLISKNVLLLTDTTNTGELVAKVTGFLGTIGCKPFATVAIYDREEGAKESLETIRMQLCNLFGPEEAIKFGGFPNLLTREKEIYDLSVVSARGGL